MKRTNLIILSIILLITSGCKVVTGIGAKLSTVESDKPKTFDTSLKIEVSSCQNYEDSRKESDDLKKLKKEVKEKLSFLKYNECVTYGMDSMADFTMPFTLGGNGLSKEYMSINNKYVLGMPLKLSKALKKIEDDNMTNFDYSFIFKFENTGSETRPFTAIGHSVDESDKIINKFKIKKDQSVFVEAGSLAIRELLNHGKVQLLTIEKSK